MAISGDCQIRLASDAVVDQSDEMQLRPSAGDEGPDIIHTVNKYKYLNTNTNASAMRKKGDATIQHANKGEKNAKYKSVSSILLN